MRRTFQVTQDQFDRGRWTICLSAIIREIPGTWRSLSGILYAPADFEPKSILMPDTKWLFASQISQMVRDASEQNSGRRPTPDFVGSFLEGRIPQTMQFGDLGHCEVMPLNQSKVFARKFVELGYQGRLTFRDRYPEDSHYDSSLMCEVYIPHGARDNRPIVMIKTPDSLHFSEGGSEIHQIIEKCLALHLEERNIPKREGVLI